MFLIRSAQKKDVKDLMGLANTPGMFNLPTAHDAMLERILNSEKSFAGKSEKPKYIFVAEDIKSGKVVATSMIARQHGTEDSPHYYFKVGTEKKFSETIQTGFIHGTLTLKSQTDGPSELGGLVVSEDFRNHAEKVGRQIFFTRFLYLHQNRNLFKDQLIAELLPPLNKKGHSPLWEAIGRRFTNLDYWEADSLSSSNKEFIIDLFPQGKIYTTFLPADARNAIGKVGATTEPVLHLLKRIGFEYQNEIDPFDGGPHMRGDVSKIAPLKNSIKVKLSDEAKAGLKPVIGLIAPTRRMNLFKAIQIQGVLTNDEKGTLIIHLLKGTKELNKINKLLDSSPKDTFDFLPYF